MGLVISASRDSAPAAPAVDALFDQELRFW
jgi:hypothetical protein